MASFSPGPDPVTPQNSRAKASQFGENKTTRRTNAAAAGSKTRRTIGAEAVEALILLQQQLRGG